MFPALNLVSAFFATPLFFWGGLIASAGPTIIHLLNRRRYRTLPWAAMEFLREAMQRNRRIMQIRDLVLLVLRTFAVFLIGLALAQPIVTPASFYIWWIAFPAMLAAMFFLVTGAAMWSSAWVRWSSLAAAAVAVAIVMLGVFWQQQAGAGTVASYDGSEPLHAVLVVDNSLSMGYQTALEGTLLDRARTRAAAYIRSLPRESRVSIVPLCGTAGLLSAEPYTAEDAIAALEQIRVVDRNGSVQQAAGVASRAAASGPSLARRFVLFSDQQASNWRDINQTTLTELGKTLGQLQVVDVSAANAENSWIDTFRLQDGVADVETPATFVVQVKHEGPSPREVQVTLAVDNVDAASKTVTVQPGGVREVTFEYVFIAYNPEPGQPAMAPVSARITPDALPGDDARHLMVPVVSALPVVFVDQFGGGAEDPLKNQVGETRLLRRLLAPAISRASTSASSTAAVKHLRLNQLTEETLAGARLLVIAGVNEPGAATPLLREYVRQGGQLMIAAGAGFDAAAWSRDAWNEGDGILPVPLTGNVIGSAAGESTGLRPFSLSYESMKWHPYFRLAGASEDDLRDLYDEPYFFKAVETASVKEASQTIVKTEAARLAKRLTLEARLAARRDAVATASDATRAAQEADEAALRSMQPAWLSWSPPGEPEELAGLTGQLSAELQELPEAQWEAATASFVESHQPQIEQLSQPYLPKTLSAFALPEQPPFLIERKTGRGRVVLMTTGLQSQWNTLPGTNTILIFDRMLRSMMQSTLPQRNYPARDRIAFELPAGARDIGVTVTAPPVDGHDDPPRTLDIGFIGENRRGVTVDHALRRGVYQLETKKLEEAEAAAPAELWQRFAVNGSPTESSLEPFTRTQFETIASDTGVAWVGPGEEISLAGYQQNSQDLWWWLAAAVLTLLLLELIIVATPVAWAKFIAPPITAAT